MTMENKSQKRVEMSRRTRLTIVALLVVLTFTLILTNNAEALSVRAPIVASGSCGQAWLGGATAITGLALSIPSGGWGFIASWVGFLTAASDIRNNCPYTQPAGYDDFWCQPPSCYPNN